LGLLFVAELEPGGLDRVAADNHFVWLSVEKVELGNYYGLAFDYTTESSLYCSDGFVVSNCRCAFMPANGGRRHQETEAHTKRSSRSYRQEHQTRNSPKEE